MRILFIRHGDPDYVNERLQRKAAERQRRLLLELGISEWEPALCRRLAGRRIRQRTA